MNANMICKSSIACCSYVEFKGMNLDGVQEWKASDVIQCMMLRNEYFIKDKPAFGHALITAAYGDGGPMQEYLTFEEGVILKRVDSLKRYIRKHKLGRLHITPAAPNPNHDTDIITMIFIPNTESCRDYCRDKHKKERNSMIRDLRGWGYGGDDIII